MSVRVMSEVWGLDLPHELQSILLALADHAHDDGSKCFPGVRYLAWKTGYDRRSVQRILRALEETEIIEVVAHAEGGRGLSAEYVIHVEKGVKKSPYLRVERAAPMTERAASGTQRAAPTPPQPSVTTKEPGTSLRDGAAILRGDAVVAEYVKVRAAHGLTTSRQMRGIIGKYAKELCTTSTWDAPSVLDAVRTFAATKRHPRWLAEWVATVFNRESEADHMAQQSRDAPMHPDVLAAINGGLRKMA